MAALTSCPRCDVSLFVPATLLSPQAHGRFRCPACQADVEAADALAVVHKTVLEAVPIGEDGAVLPPPVEVASPVVAATSPASASPHVDIAAPGVAVGEPAIFAFAPAESPRVEPRGWSPAGMAAASDAEAGEESDDDSDATDDSGAPNFGAFGDSDDDEAAEAARRRPEGGVGATVRSMLGIVLGGVIGIGGGMLILRAIQGDKFRSPIPLPKMEWVSELFQSGDHPADAPEARPEWTGGGPLTEMPHFEPLDGTPIEPPPGKRRRRGPLFEGTFESTTSSVAPTGTGAAPAASGDAPAASGDATGASDEDPFGMPSRATTGEATPAGTPAADAPRELVKGAPKRTTADVSIAMAAVAGKVGTQPPGVLPLDEPLYHDLTTLAESLAFFQSGDPKTAAMFRDSGGKLLTTAVFGRPNVDAATTMGLKSLADGSPSATGVLLAGQIVKMSRGKGLFIFQIEPRTAAGKSIVALAPETYGMIEYDRVLLAGVIVADPAVNVVGYEGDAAQAVWVGYLGRLSSAALAAPSASPKAPTASPKVPATGEPPAAPSPEPKPAQEKTPPAPAAAETPAGESPVEPTSELKKPEPEPTPAPAPAPVPAVEPSAAPAPEAPPASEPSAEAPPANP